MFGAFDIGYDQFVGAAEFHHEITQRDALDGRDRNPTSTDGATKVVITK